MITIKVLGTGCPSCKKVEQVAKRAIISAGVDAEIVKVTDLSEIMAYGILNTPGLVIDKQVVSVGRIPREAEVVVWLEDALDAAESNAMRAP